MGKGVGKATTRGQGHGDRETTQRHTIQAECQAVCAVRPPPPLAPGRGSKWGEYTAAKPPNQTNSTNSSHQPLPHYRHTMGMAIYLRPGQHHWEGHKATRQVKGWLE